MSANRPFQPRPFSHAKRLDGIAPTVLSPNVLAPTVQELMQRADHIRLWTPRQIARKLRLGYGPLVQRRIRRALGQLWRGGTICRYVVADEQVRYGLPELQTDATASAGFEMACAGCHQQAVTTATYGAVCPACQS